MMQSGRFLLFLCCWLGSIMSVQAAEVSVLRFGAYATERPAEELRKMEPFRLAIEDGLQKRGLRVRVEVRIFPTYEEGVQAIIDGDVDVARLGPVNYVLAKQRNAAIQLLAVEAHEGRKTFSGMILVAANSPIRNLADLRGKRVAFGDPTSTTGRYLAQAAMVQAGITARDLGSFEYLGRHDKVIFAVANGSYDAGAANERTFDKHARERGLRALVRFPSPTQAWVTRPGIDPALARTVRAALLEMQGQALEYIDRNGFLPGNDSDYDELRQVIRVARGFGG